MNKAAKVTVYSAVLVFIGFGLGYACANMPFGKENAKGDITKVSRFSKNTVSPQASAYQEKIMNDPAAMEQAKASLALLGSRMEDFDYLVGFARKSCQGNDYFASSLADMERISPLSANAKNIALAASESFDAMVEGKKGAASDYETASHNLILAYLIVGRQASMGKTFVQTVDEYLKDRNVQDNYALATTRDLWAAYLASQAYIDENKEDLDYWAEQKSLLTEDDVLALQNVNLQKAVWHNTEDISCIVRCAENLDAMGQVVEDFANLECLLAVRKLGIARLSVSGTDVIGALRAFNIEAYERYFNTETLEMKCLFNNIDVDQTSTWM